MTPAITLARLANGACRCHWCRNESIDTDCRYGLIVGGVLLTDPLCSKRCALEEARFSKRGPIAMRGESS
jgi:hypothetical protein